MRDELGIHNIGDQLLARADHGRSSFVTRALDAEDVGVAHETIVKRPEGVILSEQSESKDPYCDRITVSLSDRLLAAIVVLRLLATLGAQDDSFPLPTMRHLSPRYNHCNAAACHQHCSRVARPRLSGLF